MIRTELMTLARIMQRVAFAFPLIAAMMMGSPAQAQLWDWDWGGGNEVGGAGAQTVRFAPKEKAGQIFVSFTDKRLYLVTKPGEAISYPIAIPREQSRWQGTMNITNKRVNPSWTPTAHMRQENPKL